MKKTFKICVSILLLIISPFVCNYLIGKYEAYKYQAPGQFIKIDGEDMHYLYTGQTHITPAVVLIAGGGSSLLEWSLVQPQISRFARVVSYDRKGLGFSPISSKPRTIENLAQDLYQLLKTVPGPYILVGHSMAGIIIPKLVSDHSDLDIRSVVLVDAIEGNFREYFPLIFQHPEPKWKVLLKVYSSYFRVYDWFFQSEPQYFGKASEVYKAFDAPIKEAIFANFYARDILGSYAETAENYEGSPIYFHNLDNAKSVTNILIEKKIPVFIVSSESFTKAQTKNSEDNNAFRKLQSDLKNKYGNQIIVKGSDHFITRHDPQVITDIVRNSINKNE
jgi:pimeloyl-ACP methyl ester carboxylesterase